MTSKKLYKSLQNKEKRFRTSLKKVSSKKIIKLISKSRFSFLTLIIGLLLLSSGGYHFYSDRVLTFNYQPQRVEAPRANSITQISFLNSETILPVEPSQIINGVWEISDNAASHLESSSMPQMGGNIVIYAHNKPHLFGPLLEVKAGDTISIFTDNNQSHEYVIDKTFTVRPDNIDPVLPKDTETLTLYTCTGLFDSQRFIVIAYPEVE